MIRHWMVLGIKKSDIVEKHGLVQGSTANVIMKSEKHDKEKGTLNIFKRKKYKTTRFFS